MLQWIGYRFRKTAKIQSKHECTLGTACNLNITQVGVTGKGE